MQKKSWIAGSLVLAGVVFCTPALATMPLPDHQEFGVALQVPFAATATRPITLHFEYPGAAPGTPIAWEVDVLDASGQVRRHWQGSTTLAKARDSLVRMNWDGRDAQRVALAPGYYTVRLRALALDDTVIGRIGSGLASQALALAQTKAPEPDYTLSYNVGVVSDYRYRGISQSARKPALQGGIDRLAHTANQLLALARAEPSAHRASDFTPLALPELVGAVVSTLLDRSLVADVDLGADCQPAEVEGIHWLLHELLVNLVDNAIRHTPPGGQVTVRCGTAEGLAYLEVEDDGPGIPPDLRQRVRERFYHAGGNGQGSGLGLSIVEEIARTHRGRLLILDGSAGGARMRVELPAAG